ncbi:MAG: PBP1A family penicillin-binding protein [Alphaproteobacteria bacterium]|nr:PBP1A family penicillin-binding protein [Alphaproteobacteria bacterium]
MAQLAADPTRNPNKKAAAKAAKAAQKKSGAKGSNGGNGGGGSDGGDNGSGGKRKKRKSGFFSRLVTMMISLGLLGALGGIGAVVFVLTYFGRDLPDYRALADYDPPIVTRAYASDGRLLAEFATEKRIFVPIESVPPLVVHAFISAEDKHFYTHMGIDPMGIARAAVTDIMHPGKRMKGASTITQQVAKNFLLKDEVADEKGNIVAKFGRKIREAILSFRIEQALTKDKILELYLNEIYLGSRSYGVAAASLEYFNKPLDELTVAEAAFLGGLPKAPSDYNPERNYQASFDRRNYVIREMFENGYITKEEKEKAEAEPITLIHRDSRQYVNYPYFAEEVRRKLQDLYGDKGLYEGGLIAHTTMRPRYQAIAEKALRDGLMAYDMRHGLHSDPIAHIDLTGWAEALGKVETPKGTGDLSPAVVLSADAKKAVIGLLGGGKGVITYDNMKWASRKGKPTPGKASDVLKPGDVWLTEKTDDKPVDKLPVYGLREIPKVEGGVIVMDPHTGRIYAMAGGFSYHMSQFNRATQAERQPGSSFKPFVYLTALEAGFTPATLILDAPFVLDQGNGQGTWRPKNYEEDEYGGPTTMRRGLEQSRNLMTIRLANYVGMDKVSQTAQEFGIMDNMPPYLSYAIGAGETTLIRMVAGYSSFANGGKKVVPTLIDRIQDRHGKTIYVHDKRACDGCGPLVPWTDQKVPAIPDDRKQLADPRFIYQIVSMLEGVVQRGTGVLLRDLGRPLAGKTGTTNDSKDAWFIGFTPNLIVGAYVGFDEPKTLGRHETGARVAAPVVKEVMKEALEGVPPAPFRVPPGIRLVQINPDNGTRSKPGDEKSILEAFIAGTEPGTEPTMFNGEGVSNVTNVTNMGESINTGLGGLY